MPILFAALSDPHRGVKADGLGGLRPAGRPFDPAEHAVWLPYAEQYQSGTPEWRDPATLAYGTTLAGSTRKTSRSLRPPQKRRQPQDQTHATDVQRRIPAKRSHGATALVKTPSNSVTW